jgi:hypothetical protein
VKFRSDVDGTINGIRFFKGMFDTSVHNGSLWSKTGQLLATGTFSAETATGWQQLNFASPFAIQANTTYIGSYHTSTSFMVTPLGFKNAGVDSPPLHALKDGVDGGNGVYVYGTGVFPNLTFNSNNYWVDVVFSPSTSGPARFTNNGDGTITDRQTGLMWEKKNNCTGQNYNDVHCVNNYYAWSLAPDYVKPDGPLFTDFLANLNRADGASGDATTIDRKNYSDWRIPTVTELKSIVDCTRPNCLDSVFGPTLPYYHWSSTSDAVYPTGAWIVYFNPGGFMGGLPDLINKSSPLPSRGVRGGR